MLALCFAPIAAWSYFSRAEIWPANFFISAGVAVGAVAPLLCCVEVSLSCSTVFSTSSILVTSAYCTFASSSNFSVVYGSSGVFERVVLWLLVASLFSLSSTVAIRFTRFATVSSRCTILSCMSLLIFTWLRLSCCSWVIS
jgi:hypothetical protein